jgi:hypothetical protein
MKMVTFKHSQWIFVFGSNLAGKHGKGAALAAAKHFGARKGVGEGFAGRSYAIPTKNSKLETLPLDDIRLSVAKFLKLASQRPDLEFQVTRIGCGLAGYSDADIAPMFEDAPINVLLPRKWYLLLGKGKPEFRVIVAGSRDYKNDVLLESKMDKLLSKVDLPIRIVSGTQEGPDQFGEEYAQKRDFDLTRFEPNWTLFDKAAGPLRNEVMAWYSDALSLFWDGQSKGSRSMLNIATRENLLVRDTVVPA